MTEFRLLTDAEVAQYDLFREQSQAEYDEHVRLVAACGEHDWELLLELDDDIGGAAALQCTRCPAGVDDVLPDGQEFIYLQTDEGVEVVAGRHTLTDPAVVPVTVDVCGRASRGPTTAGSMTPDSRLSSAVPFATWMVWHEPQ